MLMSTTLPPEEGIGYHVYYLSKKLLERGHGVTVLTRGHFNHETNLVDGIRIIRVPYFPLYPFHTGIHRLFLEEKIRSMENEFDLMHVHSPLPPVPNTRLPMVSTIHSSVVEDARHIETTNMRGAGTRILTKIVSHRLISMLIESSEAVLVVSDSVASELKEHYGFERALVVGNGVDVKIFEPGDNAAKDPFVLFVGRLSNGKGLFDLIEAAKFTLAKHDIRFLICGKGDLGSKLSRIIEKEGLEDRVLLLGHVGRDELITLYQNATVFVMPSAYESGPIVLLEAMACGTPVISTVVGMVPNIIVNNENGILVPHGRPSELANAIDRMLENPEFRRSLGRTARRTVENGYSWDLVADSVEKVYHSIR